MRARVLSSVDIGSCTALVPRSPHTMPQRPIAVSNTAKLWPVMAGSKSSRPGFLTGRHELDVCLEFRLGKSCDPPEFRGNLSAVQMKMRLKSGHAATFVMIVGYSFHPLLSSTPASTSMQTLHVNGYDMAYLDIGQGPSLL